LNEHLSVNLLTLRVAQAQLLKFLFQDRPTWVSYLIALAIAIFYILLLFPLAFLAGHSAFFDNWSIDPLQHVSGWWAFMADKWRFPLLETKLLNAPEGANIAFTDSIPLAALVLKPFGHWLPIGFHYFGAWHAIAYILQAVAAAFLVRTVGQRSLIATLAAVCLALTTTRFAKQDWAYRPINPRLSDAWAGTLFPWLEIPWAI
jgi:hypothetical protein